jgi:hypothetical protein
MKEKLLEMSICLKCVPRTRKALSPCCGGGAFLI